VRVRVPERGKAAERVALANENARERHRVRFRRAGGPEQLGLERLARVLELPAPPRRIEAFDISHLQGTDSVASLVVFEDGKPKKSDYRLFGIASQSLLAPDDFRSMGEAVERRYRRLRDDGTALPDLILVDGGRGQLQAALTALDRLGVSVPTAGLAKREEEIWVPDRPEPIRLSRKDPGLQLVQRLRDEAHRFAITRHRGRRSRRMRETSLTQIPGVGPTRARRLLTRFGSLSGLASADPKSIEEAVGRSAARAVLEYLEEGRARSA
jgi:excinuclease ABC subunit C